MDLTYPPELYGGCSQKFRLGDYFREYTDYLAKALFQNLDPHADKTNEIESIASLMGVQNHTSEELAERCSLELLSSKREPVSAGTDQEDALLNQATRTLVTAAELKSQKAHPTSYYSRLKSIKKNYLPSFVSEPCPSSAIRIPADFLLVARIFKPFNHFGGNQQKFVPHDQDVMVLGSQTLCSFRDIITCVNDSVLVGDVRNQQSDSNSVPIKDLISSGMFYFGNTFYCDFRDMLNKDYGCVIDEWAAANPDMCLGPFEHKSMEETKFSDLEIRLGFPYVYMHLGSCEHLITFVDARLMTSEDVQDPNAYPLVHQVDTNISFCAACDTFFTEWLVEDDALPSKPTSLCDKCFTMFYTRNGQVIKPPFACRLPSRAPVAPLPSSDS